MSDKALSQIHEELLELKALILHFRCSSHDCLSAQINKIEEKAKWLKIAVFAVYGIIGSVILVLVKIIADKL
jgi:hypothetical protein